MAFSDKSLSEVHGTVKIPKSGKKWKRFLAYLGPAYLISVGYMDPGNWATDIAGGSAFGYDLLWILLLSNLMALLLQSFSARLGLVSGLDLAQASRKYYPKWTNISLYILAEIAIAACDLAEVIGMAIGLNLLFGIPVLAGVIISVLDTFLLLFLLNKGIRAMEVFIISLITIICFSFFTELIISSPDMSDIIQGFVPDSLEGQKLYIAIGIIGATVMPHNLYLHSALVQTRQIERNPANISKAIKFNTIDSAIALNIALFVNAGILILSASAFYSNGHFEVREIQDAHILLKNLFGTLAPALFAIALIAAGQSSTVTGTLAGQVVMEGYLQIRFKPWLRRTLTRIIAIAPAILSIWLFGVNSLGKLLVLSQVILSLQLGFAMIPLIRFVSNKNIMGAFKVNLSFTMLGWLSTCIIVSLNFSWLIDELISIIPSISWIGLLFMTVLILYIIYLLFYIILFPFNKIKFIEDSIIPAFKIDIKNTHYNKIAVTVDFSDIDKKTIETAIQYGGYSADYIIIHIVETAGARLFGNRINDLETNTDQQKLEIYCSQLKELDINVKYQIGYGGAAKEISKIIGELNPDLLVMGAHGHSGLKDLIWGETVNTVRHKIKIPVLVVK